LEDSTGGQYTATAALSSGAAPVSNHKVGYTNASYSTNGFCLVVWGVWGGLGF